MPKQKRKAGCPGRGHTSAGLNELQKDHKVRRRTRLKAATTGVVQNGETASDTKAFKPRDPRPPTCDRSNM